MKTYITSLFNYTRHNRLPCLQEGTVVPNQTAMGGICTTVKILRRNMTKRNSKVRMSMESPPKRENRSSSAILRELQDDGLFTKLKKGGLSYSCLIEKDVETRAKAPRRLPKLTPVNGKPKSNLGNIIYTKEEKELLVEIRRNSFLEEKGKMAKLHTERRKKLLARKKDRKEMHGKKQEEMMTNG